MPHSQCRPSYFTNTASSTGFPAKEQDNASLRQDRPISEAALPHTDAQGQAELSLAAVGRARFCAETNGACSGLCSPWPRASSARQGLSSSPACQATEQGSVCRCRQRRTSTEQRLICFHQISLETEHPITTRCSVTLHCALREGP